jgi:hypothetical protein
MRNPRWSDVLTCSFWFEWVGYFAEGTDCSLLYTYIVYIKATHCFCEFRSDVLLEN